MSGLISIARYRYDTIIFQGSKFIIIFYYFTFFMTHRLIMVIICATLFSNHTMHNKVKGRTRTGFTEVYAQNLSATVTLTFDLAT